MDADDDCNIHFAYAARNKEEAIFLEELQAIEAARGNLTLYIFSRRCPNWDWFEFV